MPISTSHHTVKSELNRAMALSGGAGAYTAAMIFRQTISICLSLSAFFAAPTLRSADQTAAHFPTSEDLRHIKGLGGPELSPDGKQVLFVVTDATADGARSHLWVVATNGIKDSLRQLTYSPPADKRGEFSPSWAPDGHAIFFLAHRGEHTQLYRLDMRGGEAILYDLKVIPRIDESKEKDAVPPPNAETPGTEKDATDDQNAIQPQAKKTDPSRSTSADTLSLPTANGWRRGRVIPKLLARKERRTPRPTRSA